MNIVGFVTKNYCDICGKEWNKDTSLPGEIMFPAVSREAKVTITTAWHFDGAHHLCKYCVLDALRKFDDRPQPRTLADIVLSSRQSDTDVANDR